ncbi:MAG: methyltransferase family protein [Oligoflexia bacterium]|jgi:protein-S-isoprenylcysteine O-methyltransferase Ste14
MNPSLGAPALSHFLLGKTRIIAAWIFGFVLILTARNYPNIPGIALCFLGASLRYWASGFLRKDSRPAVGGPYAWVRNPLYLGTYLMAVGATLSIENWPLMVSVTVLFAVTYHFVILEEETKLQKIFGAPYLSYCEAVPRFFPRPWPASRSELETINPEPSHHRFSRDLALRNKAFEAYATFAVIVAGISAIAWVWKTWLA